MDPATLASIAGLVFGLALAVRLFRGARRDGARVGSALAGALALLTGIVTLVAISIHLIVVSILAVRRYLAAPAAFDFDFRLYSLLLMGWVIWVAALQLAAAARGAARGSPAAHRTALRAALVLFVVIAPLVYVQPAFGYGLGSFTLAAVLALLAARRSTALRPANPSVENAWKMSVSGSSGVPLALLMLSAAACGDPTAPPGPSELRTDAAVLTLEPREESRVRAELVDAEGRTVDRLVTWASSDTSVVTVDQQGNVRAIHFGSATLTAFADTLRKSVRVEVAVSGYRAVSAGWDHSCALSESGRVFCWGYNRKGQLGTGDTAAWAVPHAVATDVRFATVSAGGGLTCGISTEARAYCWGAGGRIGDGSTEPRYVPTAVAGEHRFVEISLGHTENVSYTCGRSETDVLYCWGHDSFGHYGNGEQTHSLIPRTAFGGMPVRAIAAGSWHLCGLSLQGKAYCAGRNNYGQVGNGTFGAHGRYRNAAGAGSGGSIRRSPIPQHRQRRLPQLRAHRDREVALLGPQ